MGKFNNNRKNRETSGDRKMFFDTISDMRKLISKNTNSYTANTLGLGKKKGKMPYTHLVGRRNAIKSQYKYQKSRAHEESIQYDSNMKLLNSSLMKQRREKDQFIKNKYKYEGTDNAKIGRQNDQGFLQITKNDLDRIYGKKQNKSQNDKKGGFKFKGKKNNRKGKSKNKGKHNRK